MLTLGMKLHFCRAANSSSQRCFIRFIALHDSIIISSYYHIGLGQAFSDFHGQTLDSLRNLRQPSNIWVPYENPLGRVSIGGLISPRLTTGAVPWICFVGFNALADVQVYANDVIWVPKENGRSRVSCCTLNYKVYRLKGVVLRRQGGFHFIARKPCYMSLYEAYQPLITRNLLLLVYVKADV